MGDYAVYRHVFPNGKCYVGITGKNPVERWGVNGCHYRIKSQPKIARAIKKYGWDNVKHEILFMGLTEEQAKHKEQELIAKYNSIENGYNVSIGGDNINTCYLCKDLLTILRNGKNWFSDFDENWVAIGLRKAKKDAREAEYWNESYRAVIKKHGKKSPTNQLDAEEILFEMFKYDLVYWLHHYELDSLIPDVLKEHRTQYLFQEQPSAMDEAFQKIIGLLAEKDV